MDMAAAWPDPEWVARDPVDLKTIDGVRAGEHAAAAARAGAEAVSHAGYGTVNPSAASRLAKAVTKLVHSRLAPDGIRLNGVCRVAGVGTGRVREHFTSSWSDAMSVGSRGLFMNPRVPALYEVVFEQRADTGEAQSLGACGGGVRHLGLGLVNANSFVPTRIRPLIHGTPHQPGPQADEEAIARFELELGRPLPADVGEEVIDLLIAEEAVRDLVRRALKHFEGIGVTSRTHVAAAIPELLLVPQLVTGRSLPDRDMGDLYIPGNDEALIAHLQGSRRAALLFGGAAEPSVVDDDRRFPRQRPPMPLPMPGHTGIAVLGPGSSYRASRDHLVRFSRVANEVTGEVGLTAEMWRMVNVSRDQRYLAIAILEARAQQVWHTWCLSQFRRRVAPGKLQNPHSRVREGIHALQVMANAALVYTDRRQRLSVGT